MSVPRSDSFLIRAPGVRFVCSGDVRGECGVRHRCRIAARRCIARDQRACERQGGYSDRGIVMVTTRGDQ
jgi:hypothetical protein